MGGTFSSQFYDAHKINTFNQKEKKNKKIINKEFKKKLSVSKPIKKKKHFLDEKPIDKSFMNKELQTLQQYMNIENMGNIVDVKNDFINKDLARKYELQNGFITQQNQSITKKIIEYNNLEKNYNKHLYFKQFLLIFVSILIIVFVFILYIIVKRKYNK